MSRLQRVRLRVREIAQGQGWTIAGLERRIGAEIKTICNVWHDPYYPVSLPMLERLAVALDVPVTALLEDVPERNAR